MQNIEIIELSVNTKGDLFAVDSRLDDECVSTIIKAIHTDGGLFQHFENEVFFTSALEAVESYAADNGFISSENELSEMFDSMVEDLETSRETLDDEPMMREWFNNWTDSECKDGNIHDLQYSKYTYVGKLGF